MAIKYKYIDEILKESIKYKPQQRFSELKPFLEFVVNRGNFIYSYPLNNALEIGFADGGLTYILSEIFERVVAVDIRYGTMYSKYNINWVYPNDKEIIEKYAPYDLIFIDGDHSYDSVKSDFNNYINFLSKDGVIAFHDIKNTKVQERDNCKVHKFLNEADLSIFNHTKKFEEYDDEWAGENNPSMVNHGGIQIWFN